MTLTASINPVVPLNLFFLSKGLFAQHCATVLGKWIFDRKNLFLLPITHDNIYSFWTNDNDTTVSCGYKGVMIFIMCSPEEKNKCFVQKKVNLNIFLVLKISYNKKTCIINK